MTDVALFGAGRIGGIHAGNIARQPGVRLKYVVDVDARPPPRRLPRSTARKSRDGDARVRRYGGRAVAIGSSTDTHADLIMRAAQPPARRSSARSRSISISSARGRCADAVRRRGVTCMIGFQRRYDPTFAR